MSFVVVKGIRGNEVREKLAEESEGAGKVWRMGTHKTFSGWLVTSVWEWDRDEHGCETHAMFAGWTVTLAQTRVRATAAAVARQHEEFREAAVALVRERRDQLAVEFGRKVLGVLREWAAIPADGGAR